MKNRGGNFLRYQSMLRRSGWPEQASPAKDRKLEQKAVASPQVSNTPTPQTKKEAIDQFNALFR